MVWADLIATLSGLPFSPRNAAGTNGRSRSRPGFLCERAVWLAWTTSSAALYACLVTAAISVICYSLSQRRNSKIFAGIGTTLGSYQETAFQTEGGILLHVPSHANHPGYAQALSYEYLSHWISAWPASKRYRGADVEIRMSHCQRPQPLVRKSTVREASGYSLDTETTTLRSNYKSPLRSCVRFRVVFICLLLAVSSRICTPESLNMIRSDL